MVKVCLLNVFVEKGTVLHLQGFLQSDHPQLKHWFSLASINVSISVLGEMFHYDPLVQSFSSYVLRIYSEPDPSPQPLLLLYKKIFLYPICQEARTPMEICRMKIPVSQELHIMKDLG